MKIGISCYPTQGGSGVVATELGKEMAQRGHEVHFIASSLPVRLRRFDQNIYFHEVTPENYPLFLYPPYSLSLAAKMAEVTETYGLDVLHAHYAMPHAACAYLARQMLDGRSVKTVTTLHGTDITLVGQAPSFYKVTKFSIEQSDCVTSVSTWLRDETRRIFRTERPISVIPNFVDTDTFRPRDLSDRRACFAERSERIVLHISNFRPVKNVGMVVDVFERVAREIPARLLFVGDGPERIPVERKVRKLGLADRVSFLGGQEYIEDILPVADAFLLPSLHESFGLSVLEAMAVGVPVVATAGGGTREVVEDGVSGFLRDPLDLEGMVAALRAILSDPDLARSMGEAARTRTLESFRVDNVLPQYLDLYGACQP
jgi:N-acetyl-alpha-D-glucosaminyl L-malate synthase BshA